MAKHSRKQAEQKNNKMKAFTKLLSVVALGVLLSCNSEPSLQKYFVENSDNPKFVNVDIAKSSLNFSEEKLTSEELAAIETVKKLQFSFCPIQTFYGDF